MFEPRIEASNRHSPQSLPPDLVTMISDSMRQKYDYFQNKDLLVLGAIYPEEIILSIGYRNRDSLRQLNFECSLDIEQENPMDIFHLGADAIDGMIQEYIESEGDIELPLNWTEFDFENKKIFLKTSRVNTDIENLTLEFLKEHDLSQNLPDSISPEELH